MRETVDGMCKLGELGKVGAGCYQDALVPS